MMRKSSDKARRMVHVVGLVVSVMTAVAPPLGYGVLATSQLTDSVTFKAKHNGGRLARFAYEGGPLWPYMHNLNTVVDVYEFEGKTLLQTVYDAKGNRVVSRGQTPPWPTRTLSEPIVVAGEVTGRLDIEYSIRELLLTLAEVTALSLLVALLANAAMRVLPLRQLDTALDALGDTAGQLREQNKRFDDALSNMSQGLAMFDEFDGLIVCNRRFAEMHSIPESLTQPGVHRRMILKHLVARGTDLEACIAAHLQEHGNASSFSVVVDSGDGRAFAVNHERLEGGGLLETFDDVTDRRQGERQIAYLAAHDALTGLPNRVSFREHIERAFGRAARHGERFATLCLDLDQFKQVNDSLGHPVGDALLVEVARRLLGCVREGDVVSRLGGDEFAILQTGMNGTAESSVGLAQRIVSEVGAPYSIDGHQIVIGVSIGVALAPDHGTDPDTIMKHADLALYGAKEDGRNRAKVFEFEMTERAQQRRIMELHLRSALDQGQFEINYQPLVHIETGEISGFEALLRWDHPELGRVSPMDFIPVAEETGLIVPIGEWVLREACREAACWPNDVKIAVNLSAVQFRCDKLAEVVFSALANSGLPAARLELEITETVLVSDPGKAKAVLNRLRELGVSISLDDFGTGYSSLSYLSLFEIQKIKVDKSFVQEIVSRRDHAAISQCVADLGANLGMTTTAEGVETPEQMEMLRRQGFTQAQGYLFSAAVPAAGARRLLADMAGRTSRKAA